MSADVLARARDPMAWFQHDANASQDTKCLRLLARWGNAGYGAWWRLCEMLANATGHALPANTAEDLQIMGKQIGMDEECDAFIHDLVDIGLLTKDAGGCVASKRMTRNSLYFGAQRAKGAKGGRPRKSTRDDEIPDGGDGDDA